MDGFVNKWPRVHCTGCGHWIRRGEKGWRIRDKDQRPRDPVYCGVCGDEGKFIKVAVGAAVQLRDLPPLDGRVW